MEVLCDERRWRQEPFAVKLELDAFVLTRMDMGSKSQKHDKLGAKCKRSAHADLPCNELCESSTTPIPPWRDRSLWRITTVACRTKSWSQTDVRGAL